MVHDLGLMDKQLERLQIVSKVDTMYEYKNWSQKLPAFHFDKEWDVKIIPPFQGAIIRFWISYNGKFVSVYFDAYSELGWMYDENENPIPYFEYFDGEDIHRYFLEQSEQMMEDIRKFLNS